MSCQTKSKQNTPSTGYIPMKFKRHTVFPESALALAVSKGQTVRIVNTQGGQVVDTWAFNQTLPSEHLSMSHSRTATYNLFFKPGDILVSNLFNPMLSFIDDLSEGIHDTLHAACSVGSNNFFQSTSPYPNCQNNLQNILNDRGIVLSSIPDPWNLFEITRVTKNNGLVDVAATAKVGEYVELLAEQDLLIVCSACPSTVGEISGSKPRGAGVDLQIVE
jgi:uncharacterized protein YcgI (DUF1989 family)